MKKNTLKLILIVFISICINGELFGQKEESDTEKLTLKNNIIHISVGTPLANGTVFYDRIIYQNSEKGNVAIFARAGYGMYSNWAVVGQSWLLQTGFFLGGEYANFEFSMGAMTEDKYSDKFLRLSGSAGLRLQRPGGKMMFRCGLGYPEAIYVGLGFCF